MRALCDKNIWGERSVYGVRGAPPALSKTDGAQEQIFLGG